MRRQAPPVAADEMPARDWRSRLRNARRPLRRLVILLILALIVE